MTMTVAGGLSHFCKIWDSWSGNDYLENGNILIFLRESLVEIILITDYIKACLDSLFAIFWVYKAQNAIRSIIILFWSWFSNIIFKQQKFIIKNGVFDIS